VTIGTEFSPLTMAARASSIIWSATGPAPA
jgi:hypothetical protein